MIEQMLNVLNISQATTNSQVQEVLIAVAVNSILKNGMCVIHMYL